MRTSAGTEQQGLDVEWTMSPDDRVLVRAIALVGDVISPPELEQLCARWAWARPMTLARVHELESLGVLARSAHGWYVTQQADATVGDSLGMVVQSLLMVMVGGIVCDAATDLDRFRLGLRRVRFGGDDRLLIAHCRRWAASPAGQAGPRGQAFVEAMGLQSLPASLRRQVVSVVPERSGRRSLRDWIAALVSPSRARPAMSRDAGAAAVVLLLGLLNACSTGFTAQVGVDPEASIEDEPQWYTAPPPTPGTIVVPVVGSARTITSAVDRAERAARERMAIQLRERYARVEASMLREAGPTADAAFSRRLRAQVESVTVATAATAARRDYRVVPQARGYRFYALMVVEEEVADRAIAAVIRASR